MDLFLLYAAGGACLVAIGLSGFMLHRHLLRRLMAFNLIGSGSFLILTGLSQHQQGVDAVPQALVLTGIVVAVAATALALILIRRWYHLSGQMTLPEDQPDSDHPVSEPSHRALSQPAPSQQTRSQQTAPGQTTTEQAALQHAAPEQPNPRSHQS